MSKLTSATSERAADALTGPVVLTGATGFLGGHIAAAILASGVPLRAVVRSPAKAQSLVDAGAEVVAADLTDAAALKAAVAGARAVVSNASLGSWADDDDAYERVNVTGIDNLLAAAVDCGVRRVVMISTVAVYKTQLWRAMDEQAPGYDATKRRFNWSDLTTDWRYARSKTRAESVARGYADRLDLTFLRPGPIYGSGDPKLTARYKRAADRAIVLAPTVGVPQVHAGDVAAAAVSALQRPQSIGRAYNITAPPTSPWQVQRALRNLRGRGPLVLPLPIPIWVHYDCEAAARDLDFRPRSLEAGLQEALDGASNPADGASS